MSEDQAAFDAEVEGQEGFETTPDNEGVDPEIIKAGQEFMELRKEYPNVDFKELPKGFTKATQELAQLKKEQSGKRDEDIPQEELERRKVLDRLIKDDYFRNEVRGLWQQDLEKEKRQIQEDIRLQERVKELSSKYNGSDGRPQFKWEEVLKYADERNIPDPELAYKAMHEEELDEWKIRNATSRKKKAPFSERSASSGTKEPEKQVPRSMKEAREAALARAQLYED